MSILQMSIQAGLLIMAIVIIRAIALNKLPKKAFLVLWGVALIRLLIPFSISSRFSFYTLVDKTFDTPATDIPQLQNAVPPSNHAVPPNGFEVAANGFQNQTSAIDPLKWIWLIGMVIAAVFFCAVYWKGYRKLRFATIIRHNSFISKWLDAHKLHRPLTVLQSDGLVTPITIGFIKPRIIFPKSMHMENEQLLSYVLTHEYYHICRFDAALKLIVTFALCVHWFNPMVWVMFKLINRDLEITCDEMVVRHFGAGNKKAYAYSLISMAEQQSKFTPLYTGFSKNATEERITAIMKMKKASVIGVIFALILVLAPSVAFATNATAQEAPASISSSDVITKTDDEKGTVLYQINGEDTWRSLEQLERYYNKQERSEPTSMLSYLNEVTGEVMYSLDDGQTWLSNEEYERLYPSDEPNIEWYTYEGYEAFIAEQKIELYEQIGSQFWTASDGWYTLTQEMVDHIIADYERTLEEIRNGFMVSKSIDGDPNTMMSYNPEDIEPSTTEYSMRITLNNDDETFFGPYDTENEMREVVNAFCKEHVIAGNMLYADYDEALLGSYYTKEEMREDLKAHFKTLVLAEKMTNAEYDEAMIETAAMWMD